MKKDMNLYPLKVYPIETVDGIEWAAEFVDVEGCVGGGKTKTEAINEAEENLKFYLEALKDAGLQIPKPSQEDVNLFSGKLTLRISKTTHKLLADQAGYEGVSINHLVNEAISEKIGTTKCTNQISEYLDKYNMLMVNYNNIHNTLNTSSQKFNYKNLNVKEIGDYKYGC